MPFLRHFTQDERDHTLDTVLVSEAPGILAWAVRGCLEWQRQRLNAPEVIMAAVKEYRRGEDIIGQFLAEWIEESPGDEVLRSGVYEKYKTWLQSENVERIPSAIAFNKRMKNRGLREKRDGQGNWVWCDISFKR